VGVRQRGQKTARSGKNGTDGNPNEEVNRDVPPNRVVITSKQALYGSTGMTRTRFVSFCSVHDEL